MHCIHATPTQRAQVTGWQPFPPQPQICTCSCLPQPPPLQQCPTRPYMHSSIKEKEDRKKEIRPEAWVQETRPEDSSIKNMSRATPAAHARHVACAPRHVCNPRLPLHSQIQVAAFFSVLLEAGHVDDTTWPFADLAVIARLRLQCIKEERGSCVSMVSYTLVALHPAHHLDLFRLVPPICTYSSATADVGCRTFTTRPLSCHGHA